MTELEWRDDSIPVSTRFDDPYYSIEDGRAETAHVFINGNNLPDRWQQAHPLTVAELGFGTGLNFLETIWQWQQDERKQAPLHFISFEQFPLSCSEMEKALSVWPQLGELASRLIEIWSGETINTSFSSDIELTVHIGDANHILPQLEFKADAWYLDGFSPAKNPELWNDTLMREVGHHTACQGTFATYTAAGFVRRNLQSAGFNVSKTKGFGRKRDMTVGTLV